MWLFACVRPRVILIYLLGLESPGRPPHFVLFWQEAGVSVRYCWVRHKPESTQKRGAEKLVPLPRCHGAWEGHALLLHSVPLVLSHVCSPILFFHSLWFFFGPRKEELWLWRPCAVNRQNQVIRMDLEANGTELGALESRSTVVSS